MKEELLNKRESELEGLENSQPIPIAINDKACSGKKNIKDVVGRSSVKRLLV